MFEKKIGQANLGEALEFVFDNDLKELMKTLSDYDNIRVEK